MQPEFNIDNFIVAWDRNGEIEVGPWPDEIGWSDRYSFWAGAGNSHWRKWNWEAQIAGLFVQFNAIVTREGVSPEIAHHEFMKISEYQEYFESSTLYACAESAVAELFIAFARLIVDPGIDPKALHGQFLKSKLYQQYHGSGLLRTTFIIADSEEPE